MPFSQADALRTLEYVSNMSQQGALVKRYLLNPHVTRKDSVHEHIARITRLATAVLPILRLEFADQPEILEALNHLQTIVSLHDDEEIIEKIEIATFAKQHDKDNAHEIALVSQHVSTLTPAQRDYLVKYFSAFRQRKSQTGAIKMLADIAKVLDNIVGNQLAIEERTGLIQPDYAICCLRYVSEYHGIVCQTTDRLIEAQLEQMVALRAAMQNDGTAEQLAEQWAQEKLGTAEELVTRIRRQLAVDLEKHPFDKDRGYVAVWEYELPNT